MERPKISVGYRTGMLEVVEPTTNRKNGYTIWQCRCDCGGERCLDTVKATLAATRMFRSFV